EKYNIPEQEIKDYMALYYLYNGRSIRALGTTMESI
ncbi:unnamed protein product, partial [marine sediment metagenome]